MFEIPEEALENLLAAITRMNIGFVLDGTVEAEPLRAPPTGPIPLGGPLPPPADTPQEGERRHTTTSTWEEMEAALRKFRERDRECQRARAELFAAFQTWMEGHPEPPKAAKNWWRLVEDKREEFRHTADWTAARAETRRQKALEEEAARKQAEEEEARRLAEARAELGGSERSG